MQQSLFINPGEVPSRLHQLGLEENDLREALEFALRHSVECTSHDPPSVPGFLMWAKTSRALRDRLVPRGWKPSNARNYATVVSPSGTHAIAVAGGDVHTGIPLKTPSTRREKGPATRDAIEQNQLTFSDRDPTFPRAPAPSPSQTWLLVHCEDRSKDEVRLELSLPSAMTAEGVVTAWRERIILRPLRFGESTPSIPDDPADDPDVEIERRR